MSKIVIVGPGAIGTLFAAYLSKSAHEVWFFDKDPKRARNLSAQPLKIEGVSGKWQATVKATCEPEPLKNADFIFICVKSYDTKSVVSKVAGIISANTLVITLQNGIGNVEAICEELPDDSVVAAVTSMGATLIDQGYVRHAGMGETVLGRLDGKTSPGLRQLREMLNKAGLVCKVSKDINGLLWSKLIINCAINPLTAVTRLLNGSLLEHEWTHQIMTRCATEALKVAKRKRVKLIFDDPLGKVETVCEATAKNISSMLQDVLKNKKTEIDFINGVIIRHGKSLGIATPVNQLLYELVKTIEASYEKRVIGI